MLFKEWKAYAPHITICFGIEGWSDFKTMLNLTNDTDYVKGDWYQIYRSKIILCPFLDYRHMSTDRITAIAQHARTLLDAHP